MAKSLIVTKAEQTKIANALGNEAKLNDSAKEQFAIVVSILKQHQWEDKEGYDTVKEGFKKAFTDAGRSVDAFPMFWTRLLKAAEMRSPNSKQSEGGSKGRKARQTTGKPGEVKAMTPMEFVQAVSDGDEDLRIALTWALQHPDTFVDVFKAYQASQSKPAKRKAIM